ncbi:MAG: helicase associated domain-containing protein [Candidatus Methylumidiphilus sp.]
MFARLVRFKLENGHCCVPQTYPPDQDLRRWIHRQRCLKKKNRLPTILENKLDGEGVIWNSLEDDFHGHMHELMAFKKIHGHCRVPLDYPPSPKLGKWLRFVTRSKKLNLLTKKKVDALSLLGVEWNRSLRDEKWMAMFGKLVEFVESNGHCSVPIKYPPCQSLPFWIINQKTAEAKGRMNSERKSMLGFLGMVWRANNNGHLTATANSDGVFVPGKWNEQIALLAEYKEKHGHFNIRASENKKLYCFLHRILGKYRSGSLEAYKRLKLVEMGVLPED